MFACAHPAIERGMRTPLILQTILGLTAVDIASAFLVSPATMGQRLVRAKTRIKDAGIPFGVPDRPALAERLDAVLEAIYAAYAKGWGETGDRVFPARQRGHLARAAHRGLLPDQPEAKGMLALMFYAEARRPARRGPDGSYVPLNEQDTTLWDRPQIAPPRACCGPPMPAGRPGGTSSRRPSSPPTSPAGSRATHNWPAIVALYDHLLAHTKSPVVALNRAAALSEIDGPEAALSAIEELKTDKRMLDYQPYWAARGHCSPSPTKGPRRPRPSL